MKIITNTELLTIAENEVRENLTNIARAKASGIKVAVASAGFDERVRNTFSNLKAKYISEGYTIK